MKNYAGEIEDNQSVHFFEKRVFFCKPFSPCFTTRFRFLNYFTSLLDEKYRVKQLSQKHQKHPRIKHFLPKKASVFLKKTEHYFSCKIFLRRKSYFVKLMEDLIFRLNAFSEDFLVENFAENTFVTDQVKKRMPFRIF